MQGNIKTVPNQRIVEINKTACDKNHLYTTNSLSAIDEAVKSIEQLGTLKLYLYLAKNQNNYRFALSSKDFTEWANIDRGTYGTAFNKLLEMGYLEQKENSNIYIFHDMLEDEEVIIENPKAAVENIGFLF